MNEEKNDYGDFIDLLVNKPPYSCIVRPYHKHINIPSHLMGPGIIPSEVYKNLFELPSIEMHCSSNQCGGIRVFETHDRMPKLDSSYDEEVIKYICRNCHDTFKRFWLSFTLSDEKLCIKKLGEYPPFGPHIPSKVFTLLRKSSDLFVKGKRCESQNLGIGAFVYYRRVIENQKNEIFDKLIEVSDKIGATKEFIDSLKKAKKQNSFTKSVEHIKPIFPETLKIRGHNPLTLLNDALSQGVHELNDEVCLSLAQQIRVVLTRFAESLDFALKDDKELSDAVSKLLTIKSPTPKSRKKDTVNDTK